MGVGVGFNALFGRLDPEWIPKAIATLLLAIAIVIFFAAERRACAVIERLRTHEVKAARARNVRLIAWALIAAAAALIAAFWLLRLKPEGL